MSSYISRQPKIGRGQIPIRLGRDVLRSLEQYCCYLDSSRDYVIGAALEFIFRKDKHFAQRVEERGEARASVTPQQASFGLQSEAEPRARKATTRPAIVSPTEPAA